MKYEVFRVSKEIDLKDYEFELQDTFLPYFKFHPLNSLLFLAKLEDDLFFPKEEETIVGSI